MPMMLPPVRLEKGDPVASRSRNPVQRWPERNGYRAVERTADVVLMPADEVPDAPVEWLWPGVIPLGHVTLVAGETGTGKSFWMADLAARVSSAQPWPYRSHHAPRDDSLENGEVLSTRTQCADGLPHAEREGNCTPAGEMPAPQASFDEIQNPKPKIQNGSVVVVNSDDAFDDVQQPRLAAAEANLPLVALMRRLPPGSRFSQFNSVGPIDQRLQALKDAIKEAGDCKLAIVDDLARFVRDGLGKTTRAHLTLAIESLKSIAGECHVAIVVVWRLDRTSRSTARNLELFLPSTATAWLVGNDPYRCGERWVVPLKNHFGPLPEPMAFHIDDNIVVWDEPLSTVPGDVMNTFVRKSDRRMEREQAGKWALERLADGPVEADVLFDDAEAFGFSRRTVRRALVDLGLKPRKCGNDGPWLWGLERVQEAQRAPRFGVQDEERAQGTGDREHGQGSGFSVRGSGDVATDESGDVIRNPEDGQLAAEDEAAKTQDQSPKTSDSQPTLNERVAAAIAAIKDGQAPCEIVADVPPGSPQFDEIHYGTSEEDKIVIFVVHDSPGAEITEEGSGGPVGAWVQGSDQPERGATNTSGP